ncbi:MAG TPA: queuine/other tRNA-ribosyltransferase, partial [Acidimicrobiia bacterium]|nr:queuine/other tRNA-ribosyltransferase [Acidimicrobiia bacterium]
EVWNGEPAKPGAYEEFLTERPWATCPCGICGAVGIEIAIFRGSERNKRRGFHNLFVFRERLERQLAAVAS